MLESFSSSSVVVLVSAQGRQLPPNCRQHYFLNRVVSSMGRDTTVASAVFKVPLPFPADTGNHRHREPTGLFLKRNKNKVVNDDEMEFETEDEEQEFEEFEEIDATTENWYMHFKNRCRWDAHDLLCKGVCDFREPTGLGWMDSLALPDPAYGQTHNCGTRKSLT